MIHVAGYNLGLLLRALCGVGTPRELAALDTAPVFVIRTDEAFVLAVAAVLETTAALLVLAITHDAA